MADEERDAASKTDGQNRVERMLERVVILLAKGMVALAVAALVYGGLVIAFFLCCGVQAGSYVDPQRSPLGAVLTIAVIWPFVGFLCSGLLGDPRELIRGLTKFAKSAWAAVRRHAES